MDEAQHDRDEQLGNSSSVAEEVSIDMPLTSSGTSSLFVTDAAVPGALEIPTINLWHAR